METPQDLLRRIKEGRYDNLNTITDNSILSPSDTLAAIRSGELQNAVRAQAQPDNGIIADLLGGGAIGFGNMMNDVVFGGSGQIFKNLGSLWEKVSPFSGRNNNTVNSLLNAGYTLDQIDQIAPYQKSWLSTMGDNELETQNYFSDILGEARNNMLGSDPSLSARIGEGVGSTLAFMLAGLAARNAGKAFLAAPIANGTLAHTLQSVASKIPYFPAIAGALTEGGLEALTESGGFLGDAYRQGKADEALGIANKNFLANIGLNSLLDATVGRYTPRIEGIANPFVRGLASTLEEIVNENLQEPSQNIIEQASQDTLNNPGSSFVGNLVNALPQWPGIFAELAPEVTGSTLLSQLLYGAGKVSTKRGRQNLAVEHATRNFGLRRMDNSNANEDSPELASILGFTPEYTDEVNQRDNQKLQDYIAERDSLQKQLNEAAQNHDENVDPKKIIERLNRVNEQISTLDRILRPENYSNEGKDKTAHQTQQPAQTPQKPQNGSNAATEPAPTVDTVNSVGNLSDSQAANKQGSNLTRIRTMRGTEVIVRYRILDINDLIASTKETGAPNPNYPQELQPRQREREASHKQIDEISSNIDPELLGENRMASDGAPVIGSDLVVESGNGRVMALRKAYKMGKAENYRAWIKNNAAYFGLNPDEVDGIKNPVLVRERLTDVDRVKFTSEANESSIAQMSNTENAIKDAVKITDDMLSLYDPDKTVLGNTAFIQAFANRIIPSNEKGSFLQADGRISKSGIDRIINALMAKAYGDPDILNRLNERYDDEVKNISEALIASAPRIAILESGGFKPELSIKEDITAAVKTLASIRNEGSTVANFLIQIRIFDDISPAAKKILAFLDENKRGYKINAAAFSYYAELAMNEGSPTQIGIPGLDEGGPDKLTLLDRAMNLAHKNKGKVIITSNNDSERDLFSQSNKQEQKNSPNEQLRASIKQQILNAGRSEEEAEQVSRMFVSGANFFARYSGLSVDDYIKSKNLSIIFDPDQEEAKNNRGTSEFYPKVTDGAGNVLQEEQNIIKLFSSANASTLIHETGHFFLKELRDLAASGKLSGQALQDWNTIVQWLGIQDLDFRKGLNELQKSFWTDRHEMFAAGFEKYAMTGKAPNSALKRVFEAFKQWLSAIYNSIRDIRYMGSDGREHSFTLSPEVAAVFDRILSSEQSQENTSRYQQADTSSRNGTISQRDSERYPQHVKHGSGQIIEDKKYDFSKIGSGYGAFDEAWGASFSEDEDVATRYRREGLPGKGRGVLHVSTFYGDFSAPVLGEWDKYPVLDKSDKSFKSMAARDVLDDLKYEVAHNPFLENASSLDTDRLKKQLRSIYEDALKRTNSPKERKLLHEKIADVVRIKNIELSDTHKGNIYTFDISENPDLLDFDTPIYQQNQKIRNAIDSLSDKLQDMGIALEGKRNKNFWLLPDMATGRELYNAVKNAMSRFLEYHSFNHEKFGLITDPRMAASLMLDEAGIPGMFYKRKGSNKKNFVMWNENNINFVGVEGEAEEFYRNQQSQNATETAQPTVTANETEEQSQQTAPTRNDDIDDIHSIAERLEQNGKSPQAVRYATGLTRNEAGEWQNAPAEINLTHRNKTPSAVRREYQRLNDKAAVLDEQGNIQSTDKSKLSDIERERLDKIEKQLFHTTLEDVLDDETLFDVYPELRNVRYNESVMPKGVKGITSNENGQYAIVLNTKLNDKNARSALLEEIQRIIQNIEGLTEIGQGNSQNLERKPERYNQFIGVSAARELDKNEGSTERTDAYDTARKMERAGIHPHNIWLATGWGRGTDRKWRYEILDGKFNSSKRNELRKLQRELDKLSQQGAVDIYSLSSSERQRAVEISNILTEIKLNELLDNPELFRAYPQLKNVTVIETILPDRVDAQTVDEHLILINKNSSNNQMFPALIHETQHVIQLIEGFAKGSNEEMFKDRADPDGYVNTNPMLAKSFKRRADSLYRAASPKLRKIFHQLRNSQANLGLDEFDELVRSSLSRKEAEQFREFNDAANNADYFAGKKNATLSSPYQVYEQTAGEVEARNVQRRRNMSITERRLTPPDTTESYLRDNQFIFDQNGNPTRARRPSEAERYNQIIGEKGAREYDEAEGVTWRMDSLRTAQQMEKQNKSAKDIWEHTGWERGNDGRWKMEIPDGNVDTDAVNELYDAFRNSEGKQKTSAKLSDVFEAPELFSAYPELADIEVSFSDNLRSPAAVVSNKNSSPFIALNPKVTRYNPQNLRSVFVHEIQHLIQDAEGFARGGSPRTGNSMRSKALLWGYRNEFLRLEKLHPELKGSPELIYELLNEYDDDGVDLPSDNVLNKAFDLYLQGEDEGGYEEAFRQWGRLGSDTYRNLTGEVEARNVQRRMNLSEQERRSSTLEETEDTPRRRQINRFGSNSRNAERFNQIIGEQGAEALDKEEGVTWRIDNLKIAQEMDKQNTSPDRIWFTTWWEKGHEGKWKMEILDGELDSEKFHALTDAFNTVQSSPFNPKNRRYPSQVIQVNQEIYENFYYAQQMLDNVHLQDIYSNEALFNAYPQLKDIPIIIINDPRTAGAYDPDTKTIELSIVLTTDKEARNSLIHEIQHAVQHIEGFAFGGDPNRFKPNKKGLVNTAPYYRRNYMRQAQDIFDKLPPGLQDKFTRLTDIFNDENVSAKEYDDAVHNSLNQDELDTFNKWHNLIEAANGVKGTRMYTHTPKEAYRALTGETEARNTESRSRMSIDERRNTPLSQTEDIPRDDQFVVNKKGRAYSQDGERFNQPFLRAARRDNITDDNISFRRADSLDIAREQLEAVRKQYEGTDQWMKAPNGKDTNLDEKQWLQVRTKNFKDWFGDWENDPEHASRIVDENGEPRVVYHGFFNPWGTRKPFSIFDTKGRGLSAGTGAWFSSSLESAQDYVAYNGNPDEDIYPVFLNIRNPYVFKGNGKVWDALEGDIYIDDRRGLPIYRKNDGSPFADSREAYDYINDVLQNKKTDSGVDRYKVVNEAKTTDNIVRDVWSGKRGDGNHDGVIFENIRDPDIPGDVFVVPTDTNIKSATRNTGEFGRRNPDIYHQARARGINQDGRQIEINFSQDQIDEVRSLYENTDKWLKAPNGKQSNLSENLWLAVRTPNFKLWFGDWENKRKRSSKVLDENGEPLVVYHGSTSDGFSIFIPGTYGSFSSSKLGVSFSYSGRNDDEHNYPLFLNIRRPYIFDAKGKGWASLDNDEGVTDYTVEAVMNGKYGQGYDGVIFRNIKDLGPFSHMPFVKDSLDGNPISDVFVMFDKHQAKSASKNNGMYSRFDPDIYHQPIGNPRESIKNWLKEAINTARGIFSSAPATDTSTSQNNLRFENEETERRYKEGEKGIQPQGIIQRIKKSTLSLLKSFRGDFPELSGQEAARKGLLFAKEQFRLLQRKKSAKVHEAMKSFTQNLQGLSNSQRDLFARMRLLDDLNWRKQNNPDAALPFGFDDDMLRKEYQRFSGLTAQDKMVADAIKAEEQTMQDISKEFIDLAGQLGLHLDDVLRNPHYYRHTILEYANAAAGQNSRRNKINDSSLQDLVDSELGKITQRSYLRKYKGSTLDMSTNYIQANGEVRAQMLMDIEAMKTLLEIKKRYDIAPKLRRKLREAFGQPQNTDSERHNQPEGSNSSLSDFVPDGYTVYDPAGNRLVSSANSPTENILSMALDDAAQQSGLPVDKILQTLGDFGEEAINRLLVIPSEIADALKRMGQNRDRGMLGNAAKTITDWWKKVVLFSPTRNLKYNFRNFTGDLDALIAGNPKALKFFPQAVKELTDYYRGKNTTQDLNDYIARSGGLRIESIQLNNSGAPEANFEALQQIFSGGISLKSIPKKSWNLIKAFFANEQNFTAWREHLLRYAAYLAYKNDIDSNDGSPSSWGASIPDEVMSISDSKDKAYKMSNELLGAYDQVSETGKQLRDMLIPFWSWTEINMKRYYRLLKNGLSGRNSSDFTKRFMLAQGAKIPFYALSAAETFGKIALFTLAAQMFNRFVMGDDDDELPPDVKYKPHITLGKVNGQVYYFDRIGALGDAADWFALDSIFLDAKELRSGQQTLGGYMKKVLSAPAGKFLNSINPIVRMPYEIATGRSLYPDASNPTPIRDTGKYIAQSLGLNWPYKAITGETRSDWEEFKNLFVYSADADEAAYFYTLDKVRQFQERVLGKSFDGFATSQRGLVLQRLKQALRLRDRDAVRRYLGEYYKLDGTPQGLKLSMKAMNPLSGLNQDEQKQFLRWLDPEDKKYLQRANKYFHQLADRFTK